MGYNVVSIEISARLSSHNDERDQRDEDLWTELQQKIKELIKSPRYADIDASIF